MRLIDADKVLYMEYEDAMEYIEHGCDYDIDDIVEQLEEESFSVWGDEEDGDLWVISECRAIEIVKSGGKRCDKETN